MTAITKLLALAAFAVGAVAEVKGFDNEAGNITITGPNPNGDGNIKVILPDPETGEDSTVALLDSENKISCSAGLGWDENTQGELEHFINDFAAIYDGSVLARGAESSEWYTASNSGRFYLSVTNRACDNVKIEQAADVLSSTVHNCQLDGSEQFTGGALGYDVTPDTPTGCGHYLVFYADPDSLGAVVRHTRRDANCGTCSQACLNPFSTCNPPEWSRCSQQEKDCVLSQADSFYSCLIAGNCARDVSKVKRDPIPCQRCKQSCLQQGSTCNPPVWTTCTSAEQSCLHAPASDKYGCLLAGNCV